jgi:hypothetical protein
MTMHVEHRLLIQAPPARIFRIYEDVAAWHTWDPDTRCASLDGPLAVGARGSLTPRKGNTVPMLVTRVIHRVRFSGLLTVVLGRLLVRQLRQGLPVTLAQLKRLAETAP